MTGVSGLGLWPGHDPLAAQLELLEDFSNVPYGVQAYPYLVQLAQRGPGADALGRTLALLDGLPTELGPHGWKLASHPGIDLERAQTFLAQDLEALSIAGTGYTGNLTIQLVGPWTLAASVYLAKGDRVLTDSGAVRELAHALTQATAKHVAQVKERVPGAQLTVQFDESLLGQINLGMIPTFSGYSRIRQVRGPALVEVLKHLIHATKNSQAANSSQATDSNQAAEVGQVTKTVVHIGQAFNGIAPVVLSGADSFGMEFTPGTSWNEQGWELIARAQEKGVTLWAGLPAPHISQCSGPNLEHLAGLVMVGWERMGLPSSELNNLVLTQSKSGAKTAFEQGPQAVRGSLATLVRIAEQMAERAAH